MGQGGGGFGGGQGGGGFGGGGRQGGFGGGGRQGGMAGGGRFALGTVSAVDTAAKTITVTSPFAGTQTIQVSDTTQVVSQTTATVADLKVGDKVQVQGVPTGITASTLTIGENPITAGQGGGRQGGTGGPGQGGGFGGRQGGFGGGQGAQPAFASATGTVTATSPLTISLSTSVTLTLKLDPAAKVTKFSTVDLSGIKTGDQIVSTGQAGDGGVFTATTVGVNMQMGGGQGGFGGRGGQGGFGGGQGGRRRGGQGGGQGGAGGPAPDPNA